MPIVSIITVAYNHGRFIKKCIESVLAQTMPDFEQIIVDDGSTDTTAETVEQYCRKDARVRLVRHEHIGFYRMSELYNEALEASRGKLVAVLDGDDYWPPWKLEKQIPAFEDENVVLAWGKVVVVNDEGLQLAVAPTNSEQYRRMSRATAIRKLLLNCYISSVTVMCRKSALEMIGGFKQPHNIHSVDYPTWLALGPLGNFKFIDLVLGYWVKHGGNLSSRFSKSTAWCDCSIDAFEAMPQDLKEQIGLTRPELIRLLQDTVDGSIDLDLDHVYSRPELVRLFEQHLATSTIQGISPRIPLEMRRLSAPKNVAWKLVRQAGRKFLRDHDWKGAVSSFRIALACLSL